MVSVISNNQVMYSIEVMPAVAKHVLQGFSGSWCQTFVTFDHYRSI